MPHSSDELLSKFGELVATVASQHEEFTDTLLQQRTAEATTLQQLLTVLRPAFPALATDGEIIVVREGSRYGLAFDIDTRRFIARTDRGVEQGSWGGNTYALMFAHWSFTKILDGFVARLSEQLRGQRLQRTQEMREHIERLKAVSALLGGKT